MVGDAGRLLGGDLVGDDGEAVVELDLVGVDDLAGEMCGYVDGELGLAGARRAHDEDHLRLGVATMD